MLCRKPTPTTRWKPTGEVIKTYRKKVALKKVGVNKIKSTKLNIVKKLDSKKKIAKTVVKRQSKLRSSLKPGTICIIVEGRHKGKRVVFLKQLQKSGLCVITGPFGLNQCPMRRIRQGLLIATSVRLNLERHFKHFNMDRIKDQYFRRLGETKKKSLDGVRTIKVRYYKVSKKRKIVQRKVDNEVMKAIAKHKDKNHIWRYLCTKFCLKSKDYPHCMKF